MDARLTHHSLVPHITTHHKGFSKLILSRITLPSVSTLYFPQPFSGPHPLRVQSTCTRSPVYKPRQALFRRCQIISRTAYSRPLFMSLVTNRYYDSEISFSNKCVPHQELFHKRPRQSYSPRGGSSAKSMQRGRDWQRVPGR